MGLKEDLNSEVTNTFKEQWTKVKTVNIPISEDLALNNYAKELGEVTVLYADLDGSTNMVENYNWEFSAEIYKAYLRCAARIIKKRGGEITAYDGDRIMAIFTGNSKNSNATKAALNLNYAVLKIIQPLIDKYYPNQKYKIKHSVGIDCSEIRAARIGVRGSNDIVWIGRAANCAAKLTGLKLASLMITENVYKKMNKDSKLSNNKPMWVKTSKTIMGIPIYGSSWYWGDL